MKFQLVNNVENPENVLDEYHAYRRDRAEKLGILEEVKGDVKHSFARKILEERDELLVSESVPVWMKDELEPRLEGLPERMDSPDLEKLESILGEEQEKFLKKAEEGYSHPLSGDIEEEDVIHSIELNLLGIVKFADTNGLSIRVI